MSNPTFSTNYKPVPVSVKPEKDDYYVMVYKGGEKVVSVYTEDLGFSAGKATHYLQPVEDSVVLTREELYAVRLEGYRDGYRQCQDDEREGNEP